MHKIEHKGKIIEISPDFISVEILSKSACANCNAKMACGASESELKVVKVVNRGYENFILGEEVNLLLKRSLGFRAVWISYVIPLIILMILLLSLPRFFKNELYIGLFSLFFIGIYYLLIYLFRNKIGKDFVFTIEKL